MNERQIKYMLTIFREGSISRAAEVLYVSQPSVSQMVRKVEEELRAELFVRHTNPMVLTPAGECYMQAARAIQSIPAAAYASACPCSALWNFYRTSFRASTRATRP